MPDDDRAGCQINIRPMQAADLATPQARVGREFEQRPQTVPAAALEECANVLRLPMLLAGLGHCRLVHH
jgi:hypothetical protein